MAEIIAGTSKELSQHILHIPNSLAVPSPAAIVGSNKNVATVVLSAASAVAIAVA